MRIIKFTWEEFDNAINSIINQLRGNNLLENVNNVYGIPRGGLILAIVLSNKLDLPLVFTPLINTLMVDDISDSGETMYKETINCHCSCTATIHLVKDSKFIPDVWVYEKQKGDWIIYPWENGV